MESENPDNPETPEDASDSVSLRFVGSNEDGTDLHELRAAHVAEVLQGIVGLASDFTKAGAFGDSLNSEILVRPAREGSFIIEVHRFINEHGPGLAAFAAAGGVPTLSQVLWYATKSARADVRDFEYLENDRVKVVWQDDTVHEVSKAVWDELQKNPRRRKKHLRKIMAPLSDNRVDVLQVTDRDQRPGAAADEAAPAPQQFTLERSDYNAVRPEDEISENSRIFETEAQMSAIDFDSAEKWRVRTRDSNRLATMEDREFLTRVDRGLSIHKRDIFELRIREDAITKNGRTRRKWTVLQVRNHKRSVHDVDDDS
jgi:hypothetical protein